MSMDYFEPVHCLIADHGDDTHPSACGDAPRIPFCQLSPVARYGYPTPNSGVIQYGCGNPHCLLRWIYAS